MFGVSKQTDFQRIQGGCQKSFAKKNDHSVVWITVIDATKCQTVCDRNDTTQNKLYYDGNDINSLVGLNPRCPDNPKHKLVLKQKSKNNKQPMQCDDCEEIEESSYYYCRRCRKGLCTLCCEDLMEDKLQLEQTRHLQTQQKRKEEPQLTKQQTQQQTSLMLSHGQAMSSTVGESFYHPTTTPNILSIENGAISGSTGQAGRGRTSSIFSTSLCSSSNDSDVQSQQMLPDVEKNVSSGEHKSGHDSNLGVMIKDDKPESKTSNDDSSLANGNVEPINMNIVCNSTYVHLTRSGSNGRSSVTIKFEQRDNLDDIQTCIINCNHQKILRKRSLSFKIKSLFNTKNRKGEQCEQYFFEYGLIFVKKNCYDLGKFESFFLTSSKSTGLFTLLNGVLEHSLGIKRENFVMHFGVLWYDPKTVNYGFHLYNSSDKINKTDDKIDSNDSKNVQYSGEAYSNDYSFKKNDTISLNFIRRKEKHDKSYSQDTSETKIVTTSSVSQHNRKDRHNKQDLGSGTTRDHHKPKGNAKEEASIEHDKDTNKKRKQKRKQQPRHYILSLAKNNKSVAKESVLLDLKKYHCFYALSSMGMSTFECYD